MKIHITIIILLLAISFGTANAQQNFKKVDTWLNENASEMGGRAILLVYKDGALVYNHGVNKMGIKDKFMQQIAAKKLNQKVDLTDYTVASRMAIASCSKWMSAALVMTFVDEGKLKLTDTVGKYLSVLSLHGKGGITLSQCLSHLTGINAPPIGEDSQASKNVTSMGQAIEHIATLPVEGEPGKVFHYSSVGLQIAGAVLEQISGEKFETLFAKRIARPLGMLNTDFGHGPIALPAGGAFSTPRDYMNFLVMILNKGTFNGRRILSEASVQQMQINRITADVKITGSSAGEANLGYGYGEWLQGADVISSPGLFGSYPWIDKRRRYAAVLFTLNLERNGRLKRYMNLKTLVEEALQSSN